METDRVADFLLGTLAILLGLTPIGFFLFGKLPPTQFTSGFGTVTHHPLSSNVFVQLVLSLCGFVLAVAGVYTIKYGRSDEGSDTTDLY